jgi:ankyrin repeat protein
MFRNWRLRYAVRRGRIEDVRSLAAEGADLHRRDREGFTPLMTAANRGHAAVVRALVELGADVNEETTVASLGGRSISGVTPLMAACCDSAQSAQTVEALIGLGAHLDAKDSFGRTARDYVELQDYRELQELLRKAGAPRGLDPDVE